jgi:hypothetical protein
VSTHNEINGDVHGTALQIGHLQLQHVEHLRKRASSIALYYPYIHIRDSTWLKYAALYWPVVTRLVPDTYRTADSPIAAEFVRAKVLSDLSTESALPDDSGFFAMVSSRADELRARFGITKRDGWAFHDRGDPSAGRNADPRLTYLHYSKFSARFADLIERTGLGETYHGDHGSWLGMHPELAAVYMCLLVNNLAQLESLHPVTDQSLPHDALLEWDAGRITEVLLGLAPRPPHRDVTQQFMTAAVQTVVPEGLADVPVEKILELRETFPKDFHRFRKHVGGHFTDLRADATTSLHIGVAVDELVRAELAELEDKLRSVKLVPRRVRVWLKADAVRESPVGWLFQVGQALR